MTAGGSINGVARDEQGAVVPDVAIMATSESAPGVYRATTDRTGQYRLIDLPPGEYTLTAEEPVTVVLSTQGAGGHVHADAVQLIEITK